KKKRKEKRRGKKTKKETIAEVEARPAWRVTLKEVVSARAPSSNTRLAEARREQIRHVDLEGCSSRCALMRARLHPRVVVVRARRCGRPPIAPTIAAILFSIYNSNYEFSAALRDVSIFLPIDGHLPGYFHYVQWKEINRKRERERE
ncbi:hypothetical protein V1477_000372, partial [Vespula maculifrons]